MFEKGMGKRPCWLTQDGTKGTLMRFRRLFPGALDA
jgi:hypothetical protein